MLNHSRPRRFTIHENDAGQEAYLDFYVQDLEAEIERLRAALANIALGNTDDCSGKTYAGIVLGNPRTRELWGMAWQPPTRCIPDTQTEED